MSDFSTIEVTLSRYRCFTEQSNATLRLEPGKTIAILGKNNSGKSTLLRFFYEMRYHLANLHSGAWRGSEADGDVRHGPDEFQRNQNQDLVDPIVLYPKLDLEYGVAFAVGAGLEKFWFEMKYLPSHQQHQIFKRINFDPASLNARAWLSGQLAEMIYIGPIRALGNGSFTGGNHYDIAIGPAFVSRWTQLKNGPQVADSQVAQKAEDIVGDLLGIPGLRVDADSENRRLLLTSPGKPRLSIAELGSGVAEVILCVVSAAIKKPSWILIDEPESHLHPALQTKFVEALESLASCGVVFTTHSIGLARSCAVDILTVDQDDAGISHVSQLEETPNYAQLMGELSFSQYHALGYNTLLLCEGVTEIKTLRQLLRKWKLDNNVMLVPLGGDSLMAGKREAELDEFKRFGVPVYVLVDSEKTAADQPNKIREKFGQTCAKIFGSEHVLLTERRATENYLTTAAIQIVKRSDKYTALAPYEVREGKEFGWSKNDNWKIAAEMSNEDWAVTDIGRFLDQLLEPKPNNPAT